jgi:hypothetical protein
VFSFEIFSGSVLVWFRFVGAVVLVFRLFLGCFGGPVEAFGEKKAERCQRTKQQTGNNERQEARTRDRNQLDEIDKSFVNSLETSFGRPGCQVRGPRRGSCTKSIGLF